MASSGLQKSLDTKRNRGFQGRQGGQLSGQPAEGLGPDMAEARNQACKTG